MTLGKISAMAMLCVSASLMISCSHSGSEAGNNPAAARHDDDKVLNFFTWSDYIAPDTISSFEKLTGIKVNVSYFDTNEMLESRMLTGNSGFDVVVSGGPYFQRQIYSGAYLPLDKKKLPNLINLDPAIMTRVALNDPPSEVVRLVLKYLDKNPNAPNAANAHRFINYLMAPQVIANITNLIGYANANSAASPLLDASIITDTSVYPTPEQRQRLFVQLDDSPEQARAITRLWQKFKTAQ
jgi:spermidine/putrescine-binding protein